jgi:hypothetical protein
VTNRAHTIARAFIRFFVRINTVLYQRVKVLTYDETLRGMAEGRRQSLSLSRPTHDNGLDCGERLSTDGELPFLIGMYIYIYGQCTVKSPYAGVQTAQDHPHRHKAGHEACRRREHKEAEEVGMERKGRGLCRQRTAGMS